MNDPSVSIDAAIDELKRLRRILSKNTSIQVSAVGDRSIIKATSYSWFQKHRSELSDNQGNIALSTVDDLYRTLIDCTGRSTSRKKYKETLADLRKSLGKLRSEIIRAPESFSKSVVLDDEPPDFSPLVSDQQMRVILNRRWLETSLCINSGANLASMVMMGALLEALLLSRVNHVEKKSALFACSAAPKDKKGKPIPLQEWTLRHYIDVAHDQGWIRQAARDIGVVIRDYRNYIHPAKELSHNISIERGDVEVLWPAFKSIANQVIQSV